MEAKKFEYNLAGRKLIIEYGEVAKQANAAVHVIYGDTQVLSVVTSSKEPTTLDFFPLMVIYQERLYAAGKIPGGFLKREGRPSEFETLTSRVIDRPIRPLFADGFRNEVQIINTVMSSDDDNPSDITAMIGSSLVLTLSDIPFMGPIAGVHVGRIDGEFIINPTVAQSEKSDMLLTIAGTKDAINMIEAGGKEIPEDIMLEAMMFGHEEIKKLCVFQEQIAREVGKEKIEVKIFEPLKDIQNEVIELAKDKLVEAVKIKEKLERYDKIDQIKKEVITKYEETPYLKEYGNITVVDVDRKNEVMKTVKSTLDQIVKDEVRRLITIDKIRPDGRGTTEIRPLESKIDILPRTHGSALFTRGQTQALSVTTLGAMREEQIIDGIRDEDNKRFMLHYNFPSYSVGETGRYGPVGRREIGHGALGERALLQVMPDEKEFPYTVRIVSEILESNGSTSQASICAGCMSLMAAGVPIKAPVAGIAMGLVKTGDDYTILTDIQGMEDHLGDMDFKVAGTKNGITALQMDIKIDGLSKEILKEALEQARIGRLHILENMISTISAPRTELSKWAPKVVSFMINPDKIRDVIGTGGKIISKIIEDCNDVKIDIEQDGEVRIMHSDSEPIAKARAIIENLTREAEVGKVYTGKVVKITDFGAFVELWPGVDGMVHISKLDVKRVDKVEDVVKIGDEIEVKCIKVDDKGRIDLSRKELLTEAKSDSTAIDS